LNFSKEIIIDTPLEFDEDNFVELDKEILFKDSSKTEQEFQIKFSTRQANGLIMYRHDLNPLDRWELKTKDGFLVYR
jgi:hypothetical protein